MKRLPCICVSIFVSLVLHCEGKSWTSKPLFTTTSAGPGVNLKGKMVTLSQYSGVTFYPLYYHFAPGEGEVEHAKISATTITKPITQPKPTTTTTTKPTPTTTTTPKPTTKPTTTTPATRGVSVCLRFMSDSSSLNVFKLAPGSPLTLSWNIAGRYALSWNSYSQVTLLPSVSLWSSIQPQPWTSVCLVLDSVTNVVQLFEGGFMSIRKIPPSQLVWSGEPVLDVSGFDGQVTDLEVWDYPLNYGQVFSYMQNYGSSGTVLSWSNIAYRYRGSILLEETYALRQKQPIRSSEGPEQPIRGRQGRGQRLKYRKMFNGKRQML